MMLQCLLRFHKSPEKDFPAGIYLFKVNKETVEQGVKCIQS